MRTAIVQPHAQRFRQADEAELAASGKSRFARIKAHVPNPRILNP
jgi:hypothetical protein